MEWTALRLVSVILAVEALCKHSSAEWNATDKPANRNVSCSPHGNDSRCTVAMESAKWSGHFTKCPKEFRHFCLQGRCRFVEDQNTPSCVCKKGYTGARCQYVDYDLHTGDRKQFIITCVIASLVFLILLIVFICVCVHRRQLCRKWKKKEEEEEEGEEAEKLSMKDVNKTGDGVSPHTEPTETSAA